MDAALRKSDATRERILDAAAMVFRRKGYVATRLNDIADSAGIRAGSVYYHFESKEQILEEVLEIGIHRIHDAVQRALEALPADTAHRRRIAVAIEAHLGALLRHGDYSSATMRIFGQVPDAIQERHLARRGQYEALWRGLIADASANGEFSENIDLSLARLFILGALNWSMEWYRGDGRSIEAIAERFSAYIFDGLAATE